MSCSKILLQRISKLTHNNQKQSNFIFPSVSLSKLEKDYKQIKKRKHLYTNSDITNNNHFQHIHIKSPFYDRNKCKQIKCKCQFHTKNQLNCSKFISKFTKTSLNPNQNLNKNKQYKHAFLKTSENYQSQQKQQQQKYYQKNRKTENLQISTNERIKSIPDEYIYQIVRNTLKKRSVPIQQIQKTWKQYQSKIKNIKKYGNFQIDCHNYQFQQFLKQKDLVILKKNDETERSKTKNQQFIRQIQNNQKQQNKFINKKKNKQNVEFYDLQNKKIPYQSIKKIKKINFKSQISDKQKQFYKLNDLNISNLQPSTKNLLQKFMQNMFKQLKIEQKFNIDGNYIDKVNFFEIICNKLLDKDQKQIQLAKNTLKNISCLPLSIFQITFKLIKDQIDSGISLIRQSKPENIQKVVKAAVTLVENKIEQMMKSTKQRQKQGKQKLHIINKLKNKYTGRKSLNFYRSLQANRLRRILSTNEILIFKDLNSTEQKQNQNPFIDEYIQSKIIIQNQNINNQVNKIKTFQYQIQRQFSKKHIKKGLNLTKIRDNQKIVQKIQHQIKNTQNLNLILKQQQTYKRQDNNTVRKNSDSFKKKIDQEFIKNQQFIKQMKKINDLKRSPKVSEYQSQKNTVRAHYQRNKNFIQKIQSSLQDTGLSQVLINFEDNILTKKRKMRILRHILQNQRQCKNNEFTDSIIKYIEIYQKNCQLLIHKKVKKKYTRRKVITQRFFDYQIIQNQTTIHIVQDQITQLLLADKSLKFYNLNLVKLQEQDSDLLVLKISNTVSNKKKKVLNRHENIWLPKNIKQILSQTYQNDSFSLIQIGLKQHCNISVFEQHADQLKIRLQKQLLKSKSQKPEQMTQMIEKFNNKIKQYRQRIFKAKKSSNFSNLISFLKRQINEQQKYENQLIYIN